MELRARAINRRQQTIKVIAALLLVTPLASKVSAGGDFRDIAIITATVNHVLETQKTGIPFRWSNPKTGNRGDVTVTKTYYRGDGTPCREYTRTSETDGITITGNGCRTESGVWHLNESDAMTMRTADHSEEERKPPVKAVSTLAEKTKPLPLPIPAPAETAAASDPEEQDTPKLADTPAPPPPSPREPILLSGSVPSKSESPPTGVGSMSEDAQVQD